MQDRRSGASLTVSRRQRQHLGRRKLRTLRRTQGRFGRTWYRFSFCEG